MYRTTTVVLAPAADVLQLEAKAAGVCVAPHRADHDSGKLHDVGTAPSSLGAREGLPPPAIDVYSRNTASTAATESAMTSRAGLAFRATEEV